MKPVSNKEIASVFKEAKKYLATSESDAENVSKTFYICVAITNVSDINHRQWYSCSKAKKIIDERLDGYFTVGIWLKVNGFIKNTNTNINQLQKYRHRWLDSLIKEFSK
jgi:hypothetical protein